VEADNRARARSGKCHRVPTSLSRADLVACKPENCILDVTFTNSSTIPVSPFKATMFTKTVFTWRKQSAHLPSTKEEEEHFLDDNSSDCNLKSDVPKARIHPKERIAWLTLSVLLTSISCLSWFLRNDQQLQNSYEHGFNTDLQPAKSAITLIETEFYGGIIVNSTGDFNLVLNPDEELYIGTPTRELDASWDRLVGSYIALDAKEASRINGGLSLENGVYYVV